MGFFTLLQTTENLSGSPFSRVRSMHLAVSFLTSFTEHLKFWLHLLIHTGRHSRIFYEVLLPLSGAPRCCAHPVWPTEPPVTDKALQTNRTLACSRLPAIPNEDSSCHAHFLIHNLSGHSGPHCRIRFKILNLNSSWNYNQLFIPESPKGSNWRHSADTMTSTIINDANPNEVQPFWPDHRIRA